MWKNLRPTGGQDEAEGAFSKTDYPHFTNYDQEGQIFPTLGIDLSTTFSGAYGETWIVRSKREVLFYPWGSRHYNSDLASGT